MRIKKPRSKNIFYPFHCFMNILHKPRNSFPFVVTKHVENFPDTIPRPADMRFRATLWLLWPRYRPRRVPAKAQRHVPASIKLIRIYRAIAYMHINGFNYGRKYSISGIFENPFSNMERFITYSAVMESSQIRAIRFANKFGGFRGSGFFGPHEKCKLEQFVIIN